MPRKNFKIKFVDDDGETIIKPMSFSNFKYALAMAKKYSNDLKALERSKHVQKIQSDMLGKYDDMAYTESIATIYITSGGNKVERAFRAKWAI
jgi:hypothetical protein